MNAFGASWCNFLHHFGNWLCPGNILDVILCLLGILVALLASWVTLLVSFGVSWWHFWGPSWCLGGTFWRHFGCLGGILGVIGAVLGRLGGKARRRLKKWLSLPILAWLFGVFFCHPNHTKMDRKTERKHAPKNKQRDTETNKRTNRPIELVELRKKHYSTTVQKLF